jgi:predicted Zn-dependent protease
MTMRVLPVAIALATVLSMFGGCTKNAATGKSQFNFLSRSKEIAIGEETLPQMIQQYGGEVPSSELQAYVTRVGESMLPYVEGDYGELPWEFVFLDTDVINAFALPGGKVFMTRGLASRMTNEAQLAGVLGHEIGHVTAEHADKRFSRNALFAIGATAAVIGAGQTDSDWAKASVPILISGAGVFALSYDRGEELEADALGMRYMARAGYDPRGQLQVMEILREAAGGESPPEFLSTHPLPQTRIDRIETRLEDALAHTQNNPSFRRYEDRFQTEFLARLNRLPKAADASDGQPQPVLWCACCRAKTQVAQATE